jgi:hypothetical protein
MSRWPGNAGLWRHMLILTAFVGWSGCGMQGLPTTTDDDVQATDTDTDTNADATSDAVAKQSFESAGGTSDLAIGTSDIGAAALTSFDPGAFVLASSSAATSDDDLLAPAEFDGGGAPPPAAPPPPPSDGGGAAPPPPPADGGGSSTPPADGGGATPPPDDGSAPPPADGSQPPADGGDAPPPVDGSDPLPPDGNVPPMDDGSVPPPDGSMPPPPGGEFDPNNPPVGGEPPPPGDDFFFEPPPDGFFGGDLPPPPPGFDAEGGFLPPPGGFEGDGTFVLPPPEGGFEGDGGFFAPPEGLDPNGVFFVPPEGFVGDAIFVPPPPEDFQGDGFFFPAGDGAPPGQVGFEAPADFFEVYSDFPPPPSGFEGEWQPPPPSEWDGSSSWQPPPASEIYADGEWYPPAPPPGWMGEWFAPPPPPMGLEEFPGDFFFSADFDEFFVGQGLTEGPPPFAEFPFDTFLEQNSLNDILPDAPPEFVRGAFGEFEFGDVPPPPPGFPPFPPPAAGQGFGEFADFGAVFGPALGAGDGSFPDGPPPGVPPEFFAFDASVADLDSFIEGFVFPPPGESPPGERPGDAPGDGNLPPLAFVNFDDIAEFLPPDFLPPDEAVGIFDNFGSDHPLIGDDGGVNPTLEQAFADRPPVPQGYDGFDFGGDSSQYDDLFTVYDEEMVGQNMSGQVNSTFTEMMDDGTEVRCSDSTVFETVLGKATPLVQMDDGVFQTQWVVNIRQVTNSMFEFVDPDDPENPVPFEQSKEMLGQMTWTMVMQEVDTNGDGVPDEMRVNGSNVFEMLSESIEGDPPQGMAIPDSPPLILPFEFDGVLDLGAEQQ